MGCEVLQDQEGLKRGLATLKGSRVKNEKATGSSRPFSFMFLPSTPFPHPPVRSLALKRSEVPPDGSERPLPLVSPLYRSGSTARRVRFRKKRKRHWTNANACREVVWRIQPIRSTCVYSYLCTCMWYVCMYLYKNVWLALKRMGQWRSAFVAWYCSMPLRDRGGSRYCCLMWWIG